MRSLGAALILVASLGRAHAAVLGGGLPDTDCRMIFQGVSATNESSGVVCTDGDPTCDDDGVANGSCRFAVRLCTGRSSSSCDTTPLSAASVGGLKLTPPHLPAPDGTCGPDLIVDVQVDGSSGTTVLARDDTSLRDVDYLDLCCLSATPTRLDVARCAVGIDLRASGCPTRKIPLGARVAFSRARDLVKAFADRPTHPQMLARALRRLAVVHRAAKHLAQHDQCGDALGLLTTYAEDAVGRAHDAAVAGR